MKKLVFFPISALLLAFGTQISIIPEKQYPVFLLSDEPCTRAIALFQRTHEEMHPDYAYTYDLLQTYVPELIHFGQKLQPATTLHPSHRASARITLRFIELLEQQFPIGTPKQQLPLRTAKEYADSLAIHISQLIKILKETGRTTTGLISQRIAQEAQILLKKTSWMMAQIMDSPGFTAVAHFSHFFKRQTLLSPAAFRQ